jgi:hypothetical protein
VSACPNTEVLVYIPVGACARPAVKPFSSHREVLLKQNWFTLPVAQPDGVRHVALILSSIYRHFLRTSLSGITLGRSAVTDLVSTVLALLSATVFLAHALDAYRTR